MGLNASEVASLMGITISAMGVFIAITTIVVSCVAIYIQKSSIKKNEQEFKEHFDKMLDTVSQNPMVLENFIKCIVEKDEFKKRFLDLIRTETENILDSRQTIKSKEQNNVDYELSQEELKVQSQFQGKE
ncbi:hypothetical protein CQA62_01455 [Helicobacter cholecystus]|uniref:Uncharacterized protein n=1 Tax=Helicobacter cholecystus TaxID=45498 RepID=A0A3D8IYH0_9HELI|nr:hypothetical protein [Helicobacter cholecystus]RDU70103.1 hypothetical protein CQA62_01455 [Helicobacter cholecystus]VEJ24719.1 Uncharacterised protein [Helicobacter cholecystus]